MNDQPLREPMQSTAASIVLKRGALYISRDVCERYLAGLNTVILLRRESDLLILPVRNAASGGYLLKIRNAAGDRMVDGVDFFRSNNAYSADERLLTIAWSTELAALRSADAFASGEEL
jgi:hypothetical protein